MSPALQEAMEADTQAQLVIASIKKNLQKLSQQQAVANRALSEAQSVAFHAAQRLALLVSEEVEDDDDE